MAKLDEHRDIWYLILKYLSAGENKHLILPLANVNRRLSDFALREIWSEISSFYPLIALFFNRNSSYRDWESKAIAQAEHPSRDVNELGGGSLNNSPSTWDRFNYYASKVFRLNLSNLSLHDVLDTQATLLPAQWLASHHPPPLLPNLTSITVMPSFLSRPLDEDFPRLPGVEWVDTFFSIIPPTLQHAKIAWFDNTVLKIFTQSVNGYIRGLPITNSQEERNLSPASDGYYASSSPPGDHLAVIPRLSPLVSLGGLPLSTHMLELLAGLPFLSELSLYHTPEEVVLDQVEYENRPNGVLSRFPRLKTMHIVALHNIYATICPILSHFPIGQLGFLTLELVESDKLPVPHATHAIFTLLGNHARALHTFRLVVDAEKWDKSDPPLAIEGEAYAIAPWSSLSCLLSCHELRSVSVRCAGAYHGCKLDTERILQLGHAWPSLSELCITETAISVGAIQRFSRRSVLGMVELEVLSAVCPRLKVLKLTLDVKLGSAEDNETGPVGSRKDSFPLDLSLGYSVLAKEDAVDVARLKIDLILAWSSLVEDGLEEPPQRPP
ncbi:hypothetical protein FRC09_003277 [Ceratobasidium sp. 395]|nr:hypothetical protein FRC09_003277 [Ceratobasidium sp. 395]